MKIYTKTGDFGETSTFGGKRVKKSNIRIRVNGEIDELNSILGIISAQLDYSIIREKVIRIQEELMEFGADISLGTINPTTKEFRINEKDVKRLEDDIDEWDKELPMLTTFILPGGSVIGGYTHLARSVCRRAERELVALTHTEKVNENTYKYINRLSDWLFTLARIINKMKSAPETKFISKYSKKK